MASFYRRVLSALGGADAERDEELRAHLEQATQRLVARGMSPEAAAIDLPLLAAGIVMVVLGVAAVATWIPARRAATVDPAIALRAE